jgi:hypothetical protein
MRWLLSDEDPGEEWKEVLARNNGCREVRMVCRPGVWMSL